MFSAARMRILLIAAITLAMLLPAVLAECDYGDYLSKADGMDIRELSPADKIVGTDTSIEVVIGNLTQYVVIEDGLISFVNETLNETSYLAVTDACTLASMKNKTLSGIDAYNDGSIEVEGRTFGAKTKVFVGSIAARVFGWFN